jgi:predicted alpha/beta-fold hydrolase
MDRAPNYHAPFRPLPLLGNPHVQTILGHLLAGAAPQQAAVERLLLLADGDRLVLHDFTPVGWRSGGRIAVLVHGLCGSHRSGGVRRLAVSLLRHRLRVVCLDLRGAGRGAGLARRTYHGGCSEDVRAALDEMRRLEASSPLVLVGLSLGGNIVLKLAGEAAADPVPNLQHVAALAPPVDLGRCAELLAQPGNRLYERYFVRNLVRAAHRQRRLFAELPPFRFPPQMTMRRFDELYTAPLWGFADAPDYYRRASAAPLLAQIQLPTFILSARDDPFIASAPLETLPAAPGREVHIIERGGHLGFLGWDGAGGIRWLERRLTAWILSG